MKNKLEAIKRFVWRLTLAYYLWRLGYARGDCSLFRWAKEWMNYYEDGYTAREAINEDLSCG
jgi:hypothetical protein